MFKFTDTKALCEDGAWVHIKDGGKRAYWINPNGEPDEDRPIRIKVRGVDSPTFQEKTRRRAAKKLKESGVNRDVSKMSITEIEALLEGQSENGAETWADATITWENMPGDDGAPLEFTPEAALKCYEAYPAIVRQLNDEAGRIDDFLDLISTD